jgi:N-acyl-D-aspartate/D-glutamate deacylase
VNLDRIDTDWAMNVRIASCPDYREWEGKSVPEIASDHEWTIDEAVREILTSPKGKEVVCIHFIIDEADIEANLRHPRVMIGSDGIPVLTGKPHPRLFGTMPRVLSHYVRDRKVIPLEEAIRRMTSLSAERFGLAGRGLVKEGYFADLVLFDAGKVRDTATYEEPQQEPEGIAMVVVNGKIAVENGRHTRAGAGQMLRYRQE